MKSKILYLLTTLREHILFMIILAGMLLLAAQPVRAQWNTNTYENILISGLPTADVMAAPTSDGKTWIAFYHENGGNYDMRAQLIDADGYKLLGPDGMLVDNKPSGSATYVFNVCVDGDNNFIIGYQDERSGSLKAVVYKISQAGTHLWSPDGVVLGGGLAPYPAALTNGEVVVTWNADNGNTLNLQKITTSGTLAWASPVVVKVGSAVTTRGQVITNTGGKFTMVYQKGNMNTTLYSQMFDMNGSALYPPVQICNQGTAAYRYYSIISEGDTTYYGYYASVGLRFNSFVQRINPGGVLPWGVNGSNFNTSTSGSDNYQTETSISMSPGSDYVWSVCNFCNPNQTIYGVYVQKFLKSSGARQFTDQGKVVYPISASRDQRCGDLAIVNDNPIFMSYNTQEKIYVTRLDETGNFVWPDNRVEISSTTASAATPKMRYTFTPDGPDKFAGTWTENRGDGYKCYAQGISIGGLIGLDVTTLGGVPPSITISGGTLQMAATVYPANASQNVIWSIVPGTGVATISATGLVTAIANGTVFAKANAVQDTTVSDSLLITLSGQSGMPPSMVTQAATSVTAYTATLNGTANANGLTTDIYFDWGLTPAYGNTLPATPAAVTGNMTYPATTLLSGLQSSTTYHFRIRGINAAGTSYGEDLSFTTDAGVGMEPAEMMKVTVYPVPNHGRFTILIQNGNRDHYSLDVYNNLGINIYSDPDRSLSRNGSTEIDLQPLSAGIYTIILRNGPEARVIKVPVIDAH